jgi:TPR repeat protein
LAVPQLTTTRTLIDALLAALVVVSTAAAGPLEDARAAYQRGDYATAMRIYRPLADHDNAEAQSWLGFMYSFGMGVRQNYAEGAKLIRKAAEQGYAPAQRNLGAMYEAGNEGVPQDYLEAARWYRLAAEQGDASAQYGIGTMYLDGRGVPQNYVQAHMWFNLAAAVGYSYAVIDAAKERDKVAAKMTPAEIAQAQKLASEWRPKAER